MYVPENVLDENYAIGLIFLSGFSGLLFSVFQYTRVKKIKLRNTENLNYDQEESKKIVEIYNAITEGAKAFLLSEYNYMTFFVLVFCLLIFFLLGSANNCGRMELINSRLQYTEGSCWVRGLLTSLSFLIGCVTSMLSGYIGMRIAVYTNARTAISAKSSWGRAFETAFRGGSVMGFSLCSIALLVLYLCIVIIKACLMLDYDILGNYQALFECIAGFGLGGSSIALFGRVGGGIYTKAADVGADLVGKVEKNIPEDDPRNPGVIADNVGDNVGDVAGMGSDLFGSFSEATCAALVISSISPDLNKDWGSLIFPLLLSSCGIISCMLTSLVATNLRRVKKEKHIEKTLKWQLILSTILTTPLILMVCKLFLPDKFCVQLSSNLKDTNFIWGNSDHPEWCSKVTTSIGAFACVVSGLWSGLIIGYYTEYMTSHSYKPVREIAAVSDKGAAVNIIYGLALGYKSTVVPILALAVNVFIAFNLANMYGIALSALGMLSTLAIGLTIDCYGPISDNAGGIAEMAGMSEEVREKTDALDAAGNTTAAIGKGFAIGSAALVSLALFGAFVTQTGLNNDVNVLEPITFSGLLVGAMLPYLFSAMTMKSVGKAAQEMVEEVRRQFRENPGIMDYSVKPDYARCISISTKASLKEMILPGLLVILSPIFMGFFFGIHALSGLLTGSLISSVQMAISSSNTGGAWDNAKKYVEKGHHGGKGSETHKAVVIGDTVGDPLKDTSGPALNILMKLMAIISLVFANFFIKNSLPSLIPGYDI